MNLNPHKSTFYKLYITPTQWVIPSETLYLKGFQKTLYQLCTAAAIHKLFFFINDYQNIELHYPGPRVLDAPIDRQNLVLIQSDLCPAMLSLELLCCRHH